MHFGEGDVRSESESSRRCPDLTSQHH